MRRSTHPASLAPAFDSFFHGMYVLARDKVRQNVVEKTEIDAMGIWDAAASKRH